MLKENFKGIFSTDDTPFKKAVSLSSEITFTKQKMKMQEEKRMKASDMSKSTEAPEGLRIPVAIKKLAGWVFRFLALILCIYFLETSVFDI